MLIFGGEKGYLNFSNVSMCNFMITDSDLEAQSHLSRFMYFTHGQKSDVVCLCHCE